MRIIPVRMGNRPYDVAVGRGLLRHLSRVPAVAKQLAGRRVLAVSDRTVRSLHGTALEAGLEEAGAILAGWAILEPGEEHKNLEALSLVWDALVDGGLERGDCLVALGGGVVGDVAGFAAATYCRGIDFVQVPTTVLAMADSSVGGKTAIDHPRGKNLIGAFHQPRGVAADLDTLATLPAREIRSGMAEVIKAAVIGDPMLFSLLEEKGPTLSEDPEALEEAVARAVTVKARVVEGDEREAGDRALLNLGHTLGHAVEVAAGYGSISHGEAVALGLGFVARLSRSLGLLPAEEEGRILDLVGRWQYPMKVRGVSTEKIWQALRLDKKSAGGTPRWVLLRGIGRAERGHEVPAAVLDPFLREALEQP